MLLSHPFVGRGHPMNLDDILVILLAGRAGEHLYPLTKEPAKPAVHFSRPSRNTDFALSHSRNCGLRHIVIATPCKLLLHNLHIGEVKGPEVTVCR